MRGEVVQSVQSKGSGEGGVMEQTTEGYVYGDERDAEPPDNDPCNQCPWYWHECVEVGKTPPCKAEAAAKEE